MRERPSITCTGADTSAINQLVADPCLDVVPADPDQDPPHYL